MRVTLPGLCAPLALVVAVVPLAADMLLLLLLRLAVAGVNPSPPPVEVPFAAL